MLFANVNDDIFHKVLVFLITMIESGNKLRNDLDKTISGNIHVAALKLFYQTVSILSHWYQIQYFETVFKEKIVLSFGESDWFDETSQSNGEN